jgi:hypothetical protein
MDKPDFVEEDLLKDLDEELVMMIVTNAREDLQNLLQSFKENLSAKISGYETLICQNLTRDWKLKEEDLNESIHKRNRSII